MRKKRKSIRIRISKKYFNYHNSTDYKFQINRTTSDVGWLVGWFLHSFAIANDTRDKDDDDDVEFGFGFVWHAISKVFVKKLSYITNLTWNSYHKGYTNTHSATNHSVSICKTVKTSCQLTEMTFTYSMYTRAGQ